MALSRQVCERPLQATLPLLQPESVAHRKHKNLAIATYSVRLLPEATVGAAT
jgi:hypothetical protein